MEFINLWPKTRALETRGSAIPDSWTWTFQTFQNSDFLDILGLLGHPGYSLHSIPNSNPTKNVMPNADACKSVNYQDFVLFFARWLNQRNFLAMLFRA